MTDGGSGAAADMVGAEMSAQYDSPQLTRQPLTSLQPFAASLPRDQSRSAVPIQSAHADAVIRAQQAHQIFTGNVVPSTQLEGEVSPSLAPVAPEQPPAQKQKEV